MSIWPIWNAIRCPVLVVRGADSDFLSPDTLARMRRSGPSVSSVEIAGCGHAPILIACLLAAGMFGAAIALVIVRRHIPPVSQRALGEAAPVGGHWGLALTLAIGLHQRLGIRCAA